MYNMYLAKKKLSFNSQLLHNTGFKLLILGTDYPKCKLKILKKNYVYFS